MTVDSAIVEVTTTEGERHDFLVKLGETFKLPFWPMYDGPPKHWSFNCRGDIVER